MVEHHLAYLNLGSNIQPESNLPRALNWLWEYGEIRNVSNVWESEAVGATGPNYLNVCVQFRSTFSQTALKDTVIHPIESHLGRKRTADKYASRPIDIDIVIFDEQFLNANSWQLAYVVVPLAEVYPEYRNPNTGETVGEIAARLRQEVWLEPRPGVLGQLSRGR
jgi:2-amino-4-hydroxy-6-hydroxymethyldihydropteridine diphosphokinase